jgi:predicted nucleic acid binding AN1-type Zn finger protein
MANKKCFCGKKIAYIIGECKFCTCSFCLIHRLPEIHNCINLDKCKEQAKDINENKLMQEKCVANKI